MEVKRQRLRKSEKILCISVLLCVIFGHVIDFAGIRFAGLTLTLYRVGIPILAWYFLARLCLRYRSKPYILSRSFVLCLVVMSFWLLYGMVLMFISQYSSIFDGMKELLNLFLGILSVFCITECCNTKEILFYFLKVLKVMICILCLFAIVEMISGFHFTSSKYFSAYSIDQFRYLFFRGISLDQFFPVTSIFYGINDFAAFLAIFFPLFYIDRTEEKKLKIRNACMMFVITFLLLVGDANIAFITIIIAFLFMLALKVYNRYSVGSLTLLLFMQRWIVKWVANGIFLIKRWIGSLGLVREVSNAVVHSAASWDFGAVDTIANTGKVVAAQMQTAEQGYGSLYVRIMVMCDSIDMWLDSCLLGVGPSGFTNYLNRNGARSEIKNPHNFWLEILSQYGIFVFVAYIGFLLYIFMKNIKNYFLNKEFVLLRILCIMVSYVFASIAPSNFLNYSYQWIVLAVGIVSIKLFSGRTINLEGNMR